MSDKCEELIRYEYEHTFDWLTYKGKQRVDFFLPEYNAVIEYQGEEHYLPIDFAGKGEEWANQALMECIDRDKNKKKLCEKNGLKIFYIGFFEDKETRLLQILSHLSEYAN